jgi:hypothetical protein
MSKEKPQPPSITSELERLRDILYGEYARDTATRLTEFEAEMSTFRQKTNLTFGEQAQTHANQLEATRQDFEDKLAALTDNMNKQFAVMRREMAEHLARIEEAMTNRRVLGQLLSDLSRDLMRDAEAK